MFKKKEESKTIRIVCESCGKTIEQGLAFCPDCKQSSSLSSSEPGKVKKVNSQAALSNPAESAGTSQNSIEHNSGNAHAQDYFPELAKFHHRTLAALIDHAVVAILCIVLSTVLMTLLLDYVMSPAAFAERINTMPAIFNIPFSIITIFFSGIAFLTLLVLPLFYFAYFESSGWQATPGKRICGLKVIGLNSPRVNFGQSIFKSAIQLLILSAVGFTAAISVTLLELIMPLGILASGAAMAVEAIVLAAIFCFPVLRSKTQTVLDRCTGRLLVNEERFNEEEWKYRIAASPLGAKKIKAPDKWNFLRDFALGAFLLMLVPGCLLAASYDYAFAKSAASAIPLIEKAEELDPDLQSPDSSAYIKRARKLCPDIQVAYVFLGGISKCLGKKEDSTLCERKVKLTGPEELSDFLSRGDLFVREKKYDKAVSNYEKALSTIPAGKRTLSGSGLTRSDIYYILEIKTNIASTQLKQGKDADANRILTELIDGYPEDAIGHKKSELYSLRAQTWQTMGKLELATQDSNHAKELESAQEAND